MRPKAVFEVSAVRPGAALERIRKEAEEEHQRRQNDPEFQRRMQEEAEEAAERARKNEEVLTRWRKLDRERDGQEDRRPMSRSLERFAAANKRFVSFIRACSSPEELAAQRKAVRLRVSKTGKTASLVAEYVEPAGPWEVRLAQLEAALARARRKDATLLIAKLRRPRFDLPLLRALETEAFRFVICGRADLTWHTIGDIVQAATAEREVVSQRIKAALKVKREALAHEGKRLGNPNGAKAIHASGAGNASAVAALKAKAQANAERVQVKLQRIDPFNKMSASAMAAELNRRRLKGPRGGKWSAQSVIRLRRRLAGQDKL